ncbi:MAG: tRNA (guanine(10)-N(2))-dimethyltransferase [Euryarchaeota archaeon]|nr:tRNA (guanine(10)-N(2))-dimethyltransferase [Euryarchaeota archaeon]
MRVREGLTELEVPEGGVFFNPRMKLNRDVTCAVVRALGRLDFLDLLAASGAKGIRVARECGSRVHLNDVNPRAVEVIRRNAELNGVEVSVSCCEANLLLTSVRGCFNFIDVDPFGAPVRFTANAVAALPSRGYLGVTATDTAALCGVYPKACLRKYGAVSFRGELCKEAGLRILLGFLALECARYGRGMRVLLSHATDHYFRALVEVRSGRRRADDSLEQLGMLVFCPACGYRGAGERANERCRCGGELQVAGRLWLGRIAEPELVRRALAEAEYLEDRRVARLLATLAEEAEVEVPYFYDLHHIGRRRGTGSLRKVERVVEGLREMGYRASRTHVSPTGVRTDAGYEVVEELAAG